MNQSNGQNGATLTQAIERRIDTGIVSTIGVSAQRGMQVDGMGQAMEVAKLMSVSGCAVPKHLRGNPGACLAVAVQGWEWGINPFAIANKSYEVNDRLGYESALYHAVLVRRAPIKGRVRMEYAGAGPGSPDRTCRVWATLSDGSGEVEYTSPRFDRIKPKNSPLWVNDPDQQQFYFSVRSFARRHFPDVMMGILTSDELDDSTAGASMPQVQTQTRTQSVLAKVTSRPVSEGQTFVPDEAPQEFIIEPQKAEGQPSAAVQTGEPTQTRTADLSGVDTKTGEVTEPDTHEALTTALDEAAIDAGASNEAPGRFLAAYSLAKGVKGKVDKQTPAWRAECLAAFRDNLLAAAKA